MLSQTVSLDNPDCDPKPRSRDSLHFDAQLDCKSLGSLECDPKPHWKSWDGSDCDPNTDGKSRDSLDFDRQPDCKSRDSPDCDPKALLNVETVLTVTQKPD